MSQDGSTVPDYPTQLLYDSTSGRLDVVVDASPASREELSVAVGSRRIRVEIDGQDAVAERTFTLPTEELRFDGEREAAYNNGVLTVSVGTVPDC